MISQSTLEQNFEAIKKEYLESEMTLDELAQKWDTNRYKLHRLFKSLGIKRPYRKNLIGKRYGRLTVFQFLGSVNGSGLWNCKCDCGNEKQVITKILQSGGTTSCGCFQKEMARERIKKIIKPLNEYTLGKWVIAGYKHRAKKKQIPFTLNLFECFELFDKPCHYCHEKPNQVKVNKNNTKQFYYNGIDRIDSSKGYELANVVPCCGTCNRAKGAMTQKEFLTWISKLCKIHANET